MESELHYGIPPSSESYFDKERFRAQVERIKHAAAEAQQKIDRAVASNEEILLAIEIVEEFLRKKHRLCYGGQAINAHLPDPYKFYDPETSIPDYDFFTPNQNADIHDIVKALRKAGFTEISAREGMHEGTTKIYVDYIPVADITAIDPKLYRILSAREFRTDGISYLDANTLRMLMYLELSRPRGQVDRWPKVYERLMLFNEFVRPVASRAGRPHTHANAESVRPVASRACAPPYPTTSSLTSDQVHFILQFMLHKKRVFAGGDLLTFYRHVFKRGSKQIDWIFRNKKPILFYSPEPELDANLLQAEIIATTPPSLNEKGKPKYKKGNVTTKVIQSKGADLIPSLHVISRGKQPLVFIIHQSACHSYVNVPMKDKQVLRIASLDTLITLYFSLGLINSSYFDMGAMECLANQMVDMSMLARRHEDQFAFPFISITCAGHQTALSSLIRAKVQRMLRKKKTVKNVMAISTKTIKLNPNQRRTTAKNKKRISGAKY